MISSAAVTHTHHPMCCRMAVFHGRKLLKQADQMQAGRMDIVTGHAGGQQM